MKSSRAVTPPAGRPVAGGPAAGAAAGRVIAGTARGTRLAAPGQMTRPIGDRVKEALFAILAPELRGAVVLDLFAGSGAAGIEALSRGAAAATFIERDRTAEAAIRANLERTHFGPPAASVVRAEVLGWLAGGGRRVGLPPFSVVILDPPYDAPALLLETLDHLGRSGDLVATGGIVVAKHFWRTELPALIGLLASERARRFGDTALTFYRVAGSTEAGA